MEEDPGILSSDEQARLQAYGDAVRDLVNADEDSSAAAIAAMAQIGSRLDIETMRDKIHPPKGAGEHEEALVRMMERIPKGWGRWIDCDAGWYPLLVRLDAELQKLSPDYEIHQVKEKYGTLRFYHSLNYPSWSADDPPSDDHVAWRKRQLEWLGTEEGKAVKAEADRRQKLANELVSQAEAESSQVCELCGDPGEMSLTLGQSPWHKTFCKNHREDEGYVIQSEWEAWYEAEGPRLRREAWERRREYFRKTYENKNVLILNPDPEYTIQTPATYVRTLEDAHQALTDLSQWDNIWAVNGEFAEVLEERVVEYYADYIHEREREGRTDLNHSNPAKTPEITILGHRGQGLRGFFDAGLRISGGWGEAALENAEYQDNGY
jgi:hypothetical protein